MAALKITLKTMPSKIAMPIFSCYAPIYLTYEEKAFIVFKAYNSLIKQYQTKIKMFAAGSGWFY